MNEQVLKAAAWLDEQIKKYPHAECGIKLIIHDRRIKRLERLVVEKVQE